MEIIFGGWGLASSQEQSSTPASVCRRTATTREMISLIMKTVSFWGATITSSTRPTSEKWEYFFKWPQVAAFLKMVLTSSLSTKGTRRHWVWDISGEHAGWWALFMAAAWLSVISVNSRVTVRDLQGLKTAWTVQSWWGLACCCWQRCGIDSKAAYSISEWGWQT